jgi:ABC-type multidrug transport system ATPase subunit
MLWKALIYAILTVLIDQEFYWITERLAACRQRWMLKKDQSSVTSMITVRNLNQKGNILLNTRPVLQDVSFHVPNGQIMAVFGLQVASRQSLVEALAGLNEFRTSGQIRLAGYDLASQIKLARRSSGFCFQRNSYYPSLTVQQNLEVFCSLKFAHTRRACAEANLLAHVLQLNDMKKHVAATLDASAARRLALSMALAGGCKALVIDQPTASQ